MPTFANHSRQGPDAPGGMHPRRWAGFVPGVVDAQSATPQPGSVVVKALRGGPGTPGLHPRRWASQMPGIPICIVEPTIPLGSVYIKQPQGGPGTPGRHPRRWAAFSANTRTFTLSGASVDSVGAVVPSAIVKLFRKVDDTKVAEVISDAVTGAFSFTVWSNAELFYVVAFSSDGTSMGVTLNTLKGS